MRVFAIGDIHGCYDSFKKLLLDEIVIQPDDSIYLLGDYIDRGKDSKGVIEFILTLLDSGYKVYTLRGNHEQMLLDGLNNEDSFYHWLENGGKETIASFGVDTLDKIEPKYIQFFKNTKLYIKTKDYIFVHAGLNFNKSNIYEDTEAMLWGRGFSNIQPVLGNKILIHGHTPIALHQILNQKGNCINLDGGCVYKERPEQGYLVAFNLQSKQFISVKNCD